MQPLTVTKLERICTTRQDLEPKCLINIHRIKRSAIPEIRKNILNNNPGGKTFSQAHEELREIFLRADEALLKNDDNLEWLKMQKKLVITCCSFLVAMPKFYFIKYLQQ